MRKTLIALIIGLLFAATITVAQIGGGISPAQYFYGDGTGVFPVDSTWHLGSTATRIAKGWFTDLDVNTLTVNTTFLLGGEVGTGGMDWNGEKMTIDADGGMYMQAVTNDNLGIMGGQVGIGTTNPTTQLYLTEDITILGDDIFATTNTLGAIWVGDGTNFNPVVMSDDATIAANGAVSVVDMTCTNCINATEIEDIYVLDAGDSMDGDLTMTSSNILMSDEQYIGISGNERIVFDTAGDISFMGSNVGIGTAAPGAKLEIRDSFTYGLATKDVININSAISGGTNTLPSSVGSIAWGGVGRINVAYDNPSAWADTYMAFSTNEHSGGASGLAERMRITNNGNVGIGTVSPTSVLGVLGNLAVGGTYGALAAPTGGLIIEGNVGIGTTGPGAKLDVSGDAIFGRSDTGKIALHNAAGTQRAFFQLGDSTLNIDADSAIYLSPNNTTAMTVYADGNVGIGDISPEAHLEVSANGTTGGAILMLSSDDAANGDLLTVLENGNVGIGTTGPHSLLQIGIEADTNDDYLQIDSEAGAPPAGDCDATNESGRMIIDHTNDRVYICNQSSGRGWDHILLID